MALFQPDWLEYLGQHEQQDDGPEATTDHIEKGQTACLNFASPTSHGQSSEGAIIDPPVLSASHQ